MTPDARFNFSTTRVAVIDASKFSAQIVRGILYGFGFREILELSSAAMAVARLRMLPTDLIICDPYPDVRANLQALTQLRDPRYGETAFAPVVVVTGSVSLELMEAAREAQIDCVLAKPFSANALLERILWAAKRPSLRDTSPSAVHANVESGVIEIW